MVCLGILWNGMQEHIDESLNDISLYGKISDAFSLELGSEYEKFVRDIYLQDEIAEWKVNKKIETMFQCSNSRRITVVFIDIETPNQVYHQFKKRMVYAELETMKTEIREKYSKIISPYFFDNVFHVTDDEDEYMDDLKVIKSYIEKGIIPVPILSKKEHSIMKILRPKND